MGYDEQGRSSVGVWKSLLRMGWRLLTHGRRYFTSNLLFASTGIFSLAVFFCVPQVSHIWKTSFRSDLGIGIATLVWTLIFLYAVSPIAVLKRVDKSSPLTALGAEDLDPAWLRLTKLAAWIVSVLLGVFDRVSECVGKMFTWPQLRILRSTPTRCLVHGAWLIIVGVGLIVGAYSNVQAETVTWLPLLPETAINLGCLSVLFGALSLAGRWQATREGRIGEARRNVGRVLAWLLYSALLGEILWIVGTIQATSSYVSLRFYSIWGVLQLLVFVVMLGRLIDTLQVTYAKQPLRFGAFVFAPLLFVYLSSSEPLHDVRLREESDPVVAEAKLGERWFDHIEKRVLAVPESQPVVIVLASGGGSRAAIFTALALEALAREPAIDASGVAGDRTLADNTVLISSVSGGSLAVAHYIRRGGGVAPEVEKSLRFTTETELRQRLVEAIHQHLKVGELKESLNGESAGSDGELEDPYSVNSQLRTLADVLTGTGGGGGRRGVEDDLWMLRSSFVDDMCRDFMAPLLRGAATNFVDRGNSLYRFWSDVYDWRGSSSLVGYGAAGYDPTRQPVAFYNATTVAEGARLIVGFPPLPPTFFVSPTEEKQTRHAARSICGLQGLEGVPDVSLSRAVRLSSNFPWGLPAGALERLEILDGGVVDNTGFDSVAEVFARLGGTPGSEVDAAISERGRRILFAMKTRGVVLVEIDSGAKPTQPSRAAELAGGLIKPIQALSNASFTNADMAKSQHERSVELEFEKLANLEANDERQATFDIPFPSFVTRLEYEFSSLGDRENATVMTAWALGTQDKAKVFLRFLIAAASVRAQRRSMEAAEGSFASFVAAKNDWLEARDAKLQALALQLDKTLQPRTESIQPQVWQNRDLLQEMAARTDTEAKVLANRIFASPEVLQKVGAAGDAEQVNRSLKKLRAKTRDYRDRNAKRQMKFRKIYEKK